MKKCSSCILQHQLHKQLVEVEVVTEDSYNFSPFTSCSSILLSFPQKSSSFNKHKQVRQDRLEYVLFQMYTYCCSTQLVAAPLNNNLNALLKQHFNEWQTLPLCHTLSRNCFTKIAVSFKSIPHQNKIIISKIYCMYQKKYCFYCPASTKTKYDITFPVLTARRCLP